MRRPATFCTVSLGFVLVLLPLGCFEHQAPPDHSPSQNAPGSVPEATAPWFEEAALAAGLTFTHDSGGTGRFLFPEIMSGGVGILDYDGDGHFDVYCIQSGSLLDPPERRPQNKLFRNLGNGTFTDVTAEAGLGNTGYGMGCACADYDNDGDTDIYLTNLGPNVLYRNNGNGTFTDLTAEAGLGHPGWGTSSAFFDYDADGWLDLVVVNYIHWSAEGEIDCFGRGGRRDYCSPMNYAAPAMDTLYRNRGNGTFADVTVLAGLDQAFGNGLGVACADFNGDRLLDIYVANDAMPNQLWINQGNGRFQDEAMIRGCAVNQLGMSEAGMGVAPVDLNSDGWFDLFVTHLEGEANRLYLNDRGNFSDAVTPNGPGAPSWPRTGFGLGFTDFNHDGFLDLYVANGKVKFGQQQLDPKDPYAEPNTLLAGRADGGFLEVRPPGGTAQPLTATSRAAGFGDLDNDGAIDLVVVNRDGPLHYLRNVSGRGRHWIMFRLLNAHGSDALNATVRLETETAVRWGIVQPGEGYCSSRDPRLHFGLGQETTVQRLTVNWPSGKTETFGPFEADQLHILSMRP